MACMNLDMSRVHRKCIDAGDGDRYKRADASNGLVQASTHAVSVRLSDFSVPSGRPGTSRCFPLRSRPSAGSLM